MFHKKGEIGGQSDNTLSCNFLLLRNVRGPSEEKQYGQRYYTRTQRPPFDLTDRLAWT